MRKPFEIFLTLALLASFAATLTAYVPATGADEKETLRLRWKSGSIKIGLSASLTKPNPNIKAESDVSGAVMRSLAAWERAANVKFEVNPTDKLSVSPDGNFGDEVSLITIAPTPENLLMFGKDAAEVSARTRVFFNKRGDITEADIVLNPYQQFSTDGSIGSFDLEATLTHEIGHLLGLDHSFAFGATMHENSGKNGVFNLPSYGARTLAESDIAAVRALYGAPLDQEECCGVIAGKLAPPAPAKSLKYAVWAEDAKTGKIAAEILTGADGNFRLAGLKSGNYRVYAQSAASEKLITTAEEIGSVEVFSEKTVTINRKMNGAPSKFDLRYVGFNGQLTELSVPLNAGKSYMVYIGGRNLDPKTVNISFNTPYLSVTPKSLMLHDYGKNVSVLSFEVKVAAKIASGEYSILVEPAGGAARHIVGALTIEEFANPWNNNVLLED